MFDACCRLLCAPFSPVQLNLTSVGIVLNLQIGSPSCIAANIAN